MVGIISEDVCRGGVFGVDVASLVFPCAAAGGPAPVCCEVGDASNEKGRGHVLCLHHGFWFAEREGFEPPEPLGSTVFKTAAIDHSAISPICLQSFFLYCGAKVVIILEYPNFLC